MLGLSRLVADDTSIGHTALDESTLKNMINIDLNNIKKWGILGSSCWLVILNIIISVLLGLNFANRVSPTFLYCLGRY
jgi:hypothetical protein